MIRHERKKSYCPETENKEKSYQGKIDFGVVSTPFEARAQVVSTDVKEIRNVFVAGEKFRHLEGKVLDYEILKELPCIFLEKPTSTRILPSVDALVPAWMRV